MRRAAGAVAVAVMAFAAPAWSGPAVLGTAEGSALLAEVFPDGLPVPFDAVLDRLRLVAGAANVATALVPFGRSLQRHAAAPDYFASPRLVVAVTGDQAAGSGAPRLADRLFLGYQPAAESIEVISYDEASGGFEFTEIIGYGAADATAEPAERRVCLECHQAGGPIFARPLWSETNANPAVADRLKPLGPEFHGAPTRQSVDDLEAFDAATDRAGRIALANRLWSEGCPDAVCRAQLLIAALRLGLGARPDDPAAQAQFEARTASLWPDGIAAITPDLPNRDPAALLAMADPSDALDTEGVFNPESPRAAERLWQPGVGAFATAAREIAAQLTPGDLAMIDRTLGLWAPRPVVATLACRTDTVGLPKGGSELRFACGGSDDGLSGFIGEDATGRIERLALGGATAPGFAIQSETEGEARRLRAAGLAPRLDDGRRLTAVVLFPLRVELALADDLGPLAAALAARARASEPALGPGPFRRRPVLALIEASLGGADG